MSESFPQHPIESVESREKGRDVILDIDLIRHPEKDYETGKLTEEGKQRFYEQLVKDFEDGISYDTIKFYVSPLSRGQEAKEPIEKFLEVSGITTAVRTNDSLAGGAANIGPGFQKEMTEILEHDEELTTKPLQVGVDETVRPPHEPPNEEFERRANEVLIRDFFDKKFPASTIGGEDIAREVGSVIDHFAQMASRLYSNSRVKLVLISHSGILEHFLKDIYLKSHPELKPGEVDSGTIGGLVQFSEGPKIRIESDANGKQKISLHFKDLDLIYPYEQ